MNSPVTGSQVDPPAKEATNEMDFARRELLAKARRRAKAALKCATERAAPDSGTTMRMERWFNCLEDLQRFPGAFRSDRAVEATIRDADSEVAEWKQMQRSVR